MKWFKDDLDTDFYSETVAANLERPSKKQTIVLWSIIGIIALVMFLSLVMSRETSVIAMGTVKPSTSLRKLESLEQGIVFAIHQRETNHVNKGEPILTLYFNAKRDLLATALANYYSLSAKKVRLEAIINDLEPQFPEELRQASPQSVLNERSVYEETIKELISTKEVFMSKVEQKLSEHESALAEHTKIRNNLDLIEQNIAIIEPLVKKQAQPRIRLTQNNRERIEEEGRLIYNESDLAITQNTAELAKLELQAQRWEIYQEKAVELTETLSRIKELEIMISGLQKDLEREVIRAPVDGTIQKMHVNSVGNIALPGEPLVDFVPDDDTTLISVKVNPKDRGSVVECLYTNIEYTAFNADKFGLVEGWVERISPDSVEDANGGTYFIADVRSLATQVKEKNAEVYHDIAVGIDAKVFIQIGEKKLYQYALKPIAKNLNSWETTPDKFNEECIELQRRENKKVF